MEDKDKKTTNPIAEAAFLAMLAQAKCRETTAAEPRGATLHTEMLADFDHVSIPTTRYEELIRAETDRDVLLRAYHALTSYRLADVLEAVLGPKPEAGAPNAQ